MQARLMNDLKEAMKAKDKVRKNTVNMLRAEIKQIEIDERIEVPEERVMEIISAQIKTKRKAIEDFKSAERMDLVEEAEKEIEVLLVYLPKQLTEEEIEVIVAAAVAETGAASMKDMGKVMGIVNPKVKGIAEGSVVAKIVKAKLM